MKGVRLRRNGAEPYRLKFRGAAADTHCMHLKLPGTIAALVLLALPAVSLGGGVPQERGPAAERGLGKLVAKDSAKQHPEAAVARVELADFGKVSWQITSKPPGISVEHAFIVRCEKGWLFDYYPGPGDVHTTKRKTPFSGGYTIPLADPDSCDFQVAGLIPGEGEKRGRVITRIYDKG
jgi:hypothetical protein